MKNFIDSIAINRKVNLRPCCHRNRKWSFNYSHTSCMGWQGNLPGDLTWWGKALAEWIVSSSFIQTRSTQNASSWMELASSCVLAQHCQPAGSHWSIWNCPSILTLRVPKQKNQTAKTTITIPKSIGKKFGWAHEPPWWPVWWRALWKLPPCSAMAAGGSVDHCVGLLMPGTAVGSEAGLLLLRSPAWHFLGSYLYCSHVLMLNSAPWRSTPMLLLPQDVTAVVTMLMCCLSQGQLRMPGVIPGEAEWQVLAPGRQPLLFWLCCPCWDMAVPWSGQSLESSCGVPFLFPKILGNSPRGWDLPCYILSLPHPLSLLLFLQQTFRWLLHANFWSQGTWKITSSLYSAGRFY